MGLDRSERKYRDSDYINTTPPLQFDLSTITLTNKTIGGIANKHPETSRKQLRQVKGKKWDLMNLTKNL
jgi:hypothetical protein